ncbi:MAG: Gfo/Idh/MocA family protein [Acidobacteriota bacterium]
MKQHRVLVVGVGSIGERHLRCLQKTGRTEVGLCEINEDLRSRVAGTYGVGASFPDLDRALEQSWDAAVIAVPAHLHIPIALRLAGAGVGLYIEKPLATSLAGLEDLQKQVREKGLPCAVAYVYRAHPVLRDMAQAIRQGLLGRLLQVVVVSGQDFAFYRPAYRQTYYTDRRTGGGAIQDALTHLFNAAEWLAGPISRIAVDASHQRIPGVEVEDTVVAIARHGRLLASYSLNQHQAPNETFLTVVGEQGTARFELHNCCWRFADRPGTPWVDHCFGPMERDDWFIVQERLFLDMLEGRSEPLCSLDEGIQTLKVNLAALESVAKGGVPVDIGKIR